MDLLQPAEAQDRGGGRIAGNPTAERRRRTGPAARVLAGPASSARSPHLKGKQQLYSWRSASIGSRCAARRAARVVAGATAEDVAEKAESLRPDVITTGIRLRGDIDGCGLCERLKDADQTSSIPVIAVTAWALGGHLERARRAGCDAVLVKPCAPTTLLAEIYRVLRRRPPDAGSDLA